MSSKHIKSFVTFNLERDTTTYLLLKEKKNNKAQETQKICLFYLFSYPVSTSGLFLQTITRHHLPQSHFYLLILRTMNGLLKYHSESSISFATDVTHS